MHAALKDTNVPAGWGIIEATSTVIVECGLDCLWLPLSRLFSMSKIASRGRRCFRALVSRVRVLPSLPYHPHGGCPGGWRVEQAADSQHYAGQQGQPSVPKALFASVWCSMEALRFFFWKSQAKGQSCWFSSAGMTPKMQAGLHPTEAPSS